MVNTAVTTVVIKQKVEVLVQRFRWEDLGVDIFDLEAGLQSAEV